MATSYSKLTRTLSKLSIDAPEVIVARMQMFAMPGAMLSARDRTEFARMYLEKQAAAVESCLSLWQNTVALPEPPRRCTSPSRRCHSRSASWKPCWRFSFSIVLAVIPG